MGIKVLHIYRTYFPDTQGGIEEVIRQVATGVNKEIESRVFSLSSTSDDVVKNNVDNGVLTIRVPLLFEVASCGFFWKGLSEFIKQCKWADVIHYHYPWPFADLLHLCFVKKLNKKTLVTYHSDVVRQRFLGVLYRPLMNAFLSSVDSVVATSPNQVASSNVLNRYLGKVSVIPLGIDSTLYPDIQKERVKYWVDQFEEPFFFFVGVLRYYKGLDTLLDAIKQAPYTLVIAGDGPELSRLKQLAQEHQLDNVKLLGQISDLDKVCLLSACEALVLPSNQRSEAFGVSLLEAAMMSKPLISTELGTGTTFVNIDKETGLVVSPNDHIGLRNAMDYLIARPEIAKKFGNQARLRYETLFTGVKLSDSYSALYHDLLH